MLSVSMLNVVYAECPSLTHLVKFYYAYYYAECRYSEHHYAGFHLGRAVILNVLRLSAIDVECLLIPLCRMSLC